MTLPKPSTRNVKPGGMTAVASPPVMTAGPRAREPGASDSHRYDATFVVLPSKRPGRTDAGAGLAARRAFENGSVGCR